MTQSADNLLADLPRPDTGEVFETLLACGQVRIERIVSSPRPDPVLYDQPQHEWVLLLAGMATLELAGERVELGAGDHLFIPAHCRHRVLATSDEPRCLWLAVHIWPAPTAPAEAGH
jgi:cupin 2 domain-containing protein